MRVKKRVKKGVKKGIKRVRSAPPEAYLGGVGVLVGGAAILLLASTKSGRELVIRTTELVLHPEADKEESQESDVPEDVPDELTEDADVTDEPEEDTNVTDEPEEDTNGDDESEVADLKPRNQRRRSARPGSAPRTAANA